MSLQRNRLEIILENIPSAVVVMEKPDGVVTYANKRAIELHGQNPCGLKFDQHPSQLRILHLDGKVFQVEELYTYRSLFFGETIRNSPIVIERPDGKRFIVNVSTQPLIDGTGKITASIAIFDDITDFIKAQESLKKSEERLNRAQRIAKLGSWEYYVKEDKAIWSNELFNIFGLKPQSFGPNVESYINLIHPDDREKARNLFQKISVGQISKFEYRIIAKDQSTRVIYSERMVEKVDEHGAPEVITGIEQDITERKQIEEKLAKYSLELEKIVEERTRQLKESERLAAIGQVAGMVGHDIRNPLQAISSEIFLARAELEEMPKEPSEESVRESIDNIEEQTTYIDKILEDLQDLAKPLVPEPVEVDLCKAVPEAISTVQIPSNIQLSITCNELTIKVMIDLAFLKRIMINLLANAIQAMPNGGKLKIGIERRVCSAFLTVEDTGAGMPKEVQDKLFTPLFTTKKKGQGFGLVSIKRMIEALGGTINFKSQEKKGTKFIIELPITRPLSQDYCI